MAAPKPVKFTAASSVPAGSPEPQPLVIIGGIPGAALTIPAATTTVAGVVKQSAAIADATTFADLPAAVTAYNALLAKLRTAGILASA